MTPREAEAILGKVGFILRTSYGALGRAATQPLLQRASVEGDGVSFTPAMAAALGFFRELFEQLPPLIIPVAGSARPHVTVYTDACYNEPEGFSGVGVVIFADGEPHEAGGAVPPHILEWMRSRQQQINQLEALGAACARLTFPELLVDRQVLHFIDNTSALSGAVHGYANSPDMAAFINALHLSDAALGADAWYEWVPSKANISDLPSRDPATWSPADRQVMATIRARPGHSKRALEWPTADELADVRLLARRVRAMAAEAREKAAARARERA